MHPHAGQLDAHLHVLHRAQGHGPGIEAGEALLLPAPVVELLAEVPVVVEEADGDERARLFRAQADRMPNFDEYAANTDREIPVIRLTPIPS